jgi:hypothetical protein
MKSVLTFALRCLLLLMLFPLTSSAADLREDMVALDRTFVPAYGVLNRTPAEPENAKSAMEALNTQWASFRQKYMATQGGDTQWPSDMAKIDRMMVAASRIVDTGADFPKARDELKGMRQTFLDMRQRLNMPYLLDDVIRFHDPMEAIHLTARGKTGEQLSDADVARISALFSEAEQRWAKVRSATVDSVFAPTAERGEALNKLMGNESRAVDVLKQALAAGDREAIAKSAQGLRGPFTALHSSFGAGK